MLSHLLISPPQTEQFPTLSTSKGLLELQVPRNSPPLIKNILMPIMAKAKAMNTAATAIVRITVLMFVSKINQNYSEMV